MHHVLYLFISGFLLICYVPGIIQVTEKSEPPGAVSRIGFTAPDSIEKLKKIYPKADFVHKGTVEYAFKQYRIDTIKFIKSRLDFDAPDITEIGRICRDNNLDILMLTRIRFIYQKLHNYYHAEADLKFYDLSGNLVFSVKCNSAFNKNFYNYPELFEVERDALKCGIAKFAKELKLKKK